MDTDLTGSARIAVLIDADNTSPKYAEALLDELAKYGTPTIKRAYGDWSSRNLGGWTKELDARAIRAMHQKAFTTGKNSTDSALIIDAMDLLYAGNVEAFAIVSSDSDFTSLVHRLRESGKTVYGLGRERTPSSLQNACDLFIGLELLGAEDTPESAPDESDAGPDAGPVRKANPQSVLTKAVNATVGEDGWASLSAMGSHIQRSQPSFDPRAFGHTKLGELVAAQPYLETQADGRATRVRLKQARKKATAKKSAAKKGAAKKS
ncbi:MAG: NYN domain-containing protein [Nocardioides sp.]